VQLTSPRGNQYVTTVIDCPCGCGIPFVLPLIAGVAFPPLGETLTQLQWRLLLNGYTVPGRVHRVINGAAGTLCGWGGRIILGRVFSRDAASEDDAPLGTRIAETLAWLRENGELNAR
jgi:hypothetical protein